MKYFNLDSENIRTEKYLEVRVRNVVEGFYNDDFKVGLVVKKTSDFLYCLEIVDHIGDDSKVNYYSLDGLKYPAYVDFSKIIKIEKDDFLGIKYIISYDDLKRIVTKVNRGQISKYIDYNRAINNIEKGYIVAYKDDLYILTRTKKNKCVGYKMVKTNKRNSISLKINNEYYGPDISKSFIFYKDEGVKVVFIPSLEYQRCVMLKEQKSYSFGDILSLKNKKNKIIYIAKSTRNIFYIDYPFEMFTKLKSISKTEVSNKQGSISDWEKEKLLQKLEKYQDNEYYVERNIRKFTEETIREQKKTLNIR